MVFISLVVLVFLLISSIFAIYFVQDCSAIGGNERHKIFELASSYLHLQYALWMHNVDFASYCMCKNVKVG